MSEENGIHHVVSDFFKGGDKSFCGIVVWRHDMPIKMDHAMLCIKSGPTAVEYPLSGSNWIPRLPPSGNAVYQRQLPSLAL